MSFLCQWYRKSCFQNNIPDNIKHKPFEFSNVQIPVMGKKPSTPSIAPSKKVGCTTTNSSFDTRKQTASTKSNLQTKGNWIYEVVSKKRYCTATSDDGIKTTSNDGNTQMQPMVQDILETEDTYPPKVSEYLKTNIMNIVYSSGNDILHALVTVTNIRKPSTSSSTFMTHISLNQTNLKRLIDPNEYIDDEVIDAFMGLLD